LTWSNDKIIEQIKSLWTKVSEIEKRLDEGSVDFKEIRRELTAIKTELTIISTSITGFLRNTWKLIFALVTIVAGLVGIKLWTS